MGVGVDILGGSSPCSNPGEKNPRDYRGHNSDGSNPKSKKKKKSILDYVSYTVALVSFKLCDLTLCKPKTNVS